MSRRPSEGIWRCGRCGGRLGIVAVTGHFNPWPRSPASTRRTWRGWAAQIAAARTVWAPPGRHQLEAP